MTAATAEHRPDLTVVSLFDGIGGFPLAFEQAGAVTVATVEIDADASAIGRRHFPDATQFDDVTKVTADDLRAVGFIPNRGVVTAGWPCQDFSVAGRRAGLAGSRSGLWWHVARILDELKPRWFFGENVPGLLSSVCQCPGDGTCIANGHGGRCAEKAHNVKPDGCCVGGCMATHGGAMGTVLGSLADLGYGFAYRVLDAQYFGVPQQRRRVFIVGHLGAPFGAAAEVLFEPESGEGDSPASQEAGSEVAGGVAGGVGAAGRDVAPAVVARYGKGTDSDSTDALLLDGAEHTHTHTTGPVSTLQGGGKRGYRIDAEAAAGGHLIVQREVVSALTTSYCGGIGGPDDNAAQAGYLIVHPTTVTGGVTHTLTSEGADASEDGTGRGTPIVVQPMAVRENQRGEVVLSDNMAQLSTGGGKPGQGYPCVVQPLALRGRAGGSQIELGKEGGPYNALRAGDGCSSRQSLIAVTYTPDVAVTLTSGQSSPGVSAPGDRQEDDVNVVALELRNCARETDCSESTGVAPETIVRRLTELECERLQGYPDEWTDGQYGSARYRQLGNSVAVPAVASVARRIVAVDAAIAGGALS